MEDPLDSDLTPDDEPPPTGSKPRQMRYMRRTRRLRDDRNGDPLDGIVNLWDVALVLAVAFLLAALAGVGLSDLLTQGDVTIVKNPGQPDMQVIQKQGGQITTYDVQSGQQAAGSGTLIGEFYRLADGTVVYVPTGATPSPGATPVSPTPGATPTPSVFTPGPTVAPTNPITPTPPVPTPAVTITPPGGGPPPKGSG